MGAQSFARTGLGNVAGDIFGDFEEWIDGVWQALSKDGSARATEGDDLKIEMSVERPALLGEESMTLATVQQHFQLADSSIGPEKRQMELMLPEGMTYTAGDYLVVLPTNHRHNVQRVLSRFDVPSDALIKLSGTRKTFLPHDAPEYAFSLLASYVELGTPVSRRQITILAEATTEGKQKEEIQGLFDESVFGKEVVAKRTTILDLLERFPACQLPLAAYIDMLQPMKPRQYSISS